MALRSFIKIHGGKFYLKDWILSLFPPNYNDMTYVESCCGGCNVLLNKEVSKREIINDLDQNLYLLISCLKYSPNEIIKEINKIPYTEEVFNKAKENKDGIYSAINELILRRMSRGGIKEAFAKSNRLRGGRMGDENAWETFKLILPKICDRLSSVEIYNDNALELIPKFDSENTLFYIDPPYLPSSRSASSVYDIEMNEKDHIKLGKVLQEVKGKVILSSYFNSLYSNIYKNWRLESKSVPNHSGQTNKKAKRLECLWMNY